MMAVSRETLDIIYQEENMALLTPAEFGKILQSELGEGWQNYSERKAEVDSESAMFGDSSPGSRIHLSEMYSRLKETEERLHRIKRACNLHENHVF